VVLALSLGATGTARATYVGTAGKIAYIDPFTNAIGIWDPVTEVSAQVLPSTWASDNAGYADGDVGRAFDAPSAPSWSPDGTRFAFSKQIDDQGDCAGRRPPSDSTSPSLLPVAPGRR
jgi:hypothetical protein